MKLSYHDIILAGASRVARKAREQLAPPELLEAKNCFVSRADGLLTLRPDLDYITAITAAASVWQDDTGRDLADFLNQVSYSVRADAFTYFSRLVPYAVIGGARSDLYSTYTTGTITTNGTDRYVNGTGTSWLQNIWAGCWVYYDSKLYLIDSVTEDGLLSTEKAMPAVSGVTYQIWRTHHPDLALWPIKVEPYSTAILIYDAVRPSGPVTESQICGPFTASITSAEDSAMWGSLFTPDADSIVFNVLALACTPQGYQRGKCEWRKQAVGNLGQAFETAAQTATTWTSSPTGVTVNINAATFVANSQYIYLACADGTVLGMDWEYLPDNADIEGKTAYNRGHTDGNLSWEAATPTSSALYGMADGAVFDAGYIAVGAGGVLLVAGSSKTSGSSEDLLDADTEWEGASPTAIVVGTNGEILSSTDLNTWSSETSGTSEDLRGVAWCAELNKWTACGTNGDQKEGNAAGSSWTDRTSATANQLNAVAADMLGHCAIAVGESDTILVSDDLATWTALSSVTGNWNCVDWWSGKEYIFRDCCQWLIGGDSEAMRRVDPYFSYAEPTGTTGTIAGAMHHVIWDGSNFVACGVSGIWTSPTGATWTQRDSTAVNWNAVAYDGSGVWVAVGDGGTIRNSTDSITWTNRTSSTANDLYDVAWDGAKFIAVGASSTVIESNAGGTTWAADAGAAGTVSGDLYAICAFSANQVACGGSAAAVFYKWNSSWYEPTLTNGPDEAIRTMLSVTDANIGIVGNYAAMIIGTHAATHYYHPDGSDDQTCWEVPLPYNLHFFDGSPSPTRRWVGRIAAASGATHFPELLLVAGTDADVRFGASVNNGRTWGSTFEETLVDHSGAVVDLFAGGNVRPAICPVHNGTDWYVLVGRSGGTSNFYQVTTRALNTETQAIT
jgi:hypothetical protein